MLYSILQKVVICHLQNSHASRRTEFPNVTGMTPDPMKNVWVFAFCQYCSGNRGGGKNGVANVTSLSVVTYSMFPSIIIDSSLAPALL